MAETGDAVKSVTSFPEDIRSCSTSKVFFFFVYFTVHKGMLSLKLLWQSLGRHIPDWESENQTLSGSAA